MSNPDDVRGRLKEAAGDLTDDKDLKREGKIDRAEGAVKEKIDELADKAKDAVDSNSSTGQGRRRAPQACLRLERHNPQPCLIFSVR